MVSIYEDLGDIWCIGSMCENLCSVAIQEDQFDLATEYGARALRIKRTLPTTHPLGVTLAHLGLIGHFRGDSEAAIRYLLEALEVFGTARLFRDTPECLSRLAQTYGKEAKWMQAAIAFVGADVMRQKTTCPPSIVEPEQWELLAGMLFQNIGADKMDAIQRSFLDLSCLGIIRHVLHNLTNMHDAMLPSENRDDS